MERIGALPGKPVRALEETTIAVRRLLAGSASVRTATTSTSETSG